MSTGRLYSGEEKALPSLTLDPPSWEGEDKLMQTNTLDTARPPRGEVTGGGAKKDFYQHKVALTLRVRKAEAAKRPSIGVERAWKSSVEAAPAIHHDGA